MNYTLYIDESGDFETDRGQWIVAGFLYPEKYEVAEKDFDKKFISLAKDIGLKSKADFHLTEIRRDRGGSSAHEVAKQTIEFVCEMATSCKLVAVINKSKLSITRPEVTYRSMVADLLQQLDTELPEEEAIDRLDLVIATRTIAGQIQTSKRVIDKEIIQSLPLALEADLTTKGMARLVGKRIKTHLQYANLSWGLVIADFVANLTYHNKKKLEGQFLENLQARGIYSAYEAFGSTQERRAKIAERDKDYSLALYRWLCIGQKENLRQQVTKRIQHLLGVVILGRKELNAHTAFEALLDRIWRQHAAFGFQTSLLELLESLQAHLLSFFDGHDLERTNIFLFRLRNLILVMQNHLGLEKKALDTIASQASAQQKLMLDPRNIQAVLDFQVNRAETFLNGLNYEEALCAARTHKDLIQQYRSVWQLLVEEENTDDFDSSRISVRADMLFLRVNTLCPWTTPDTLEKMLFLAASIANRSNNDEHASRLRNYEVMVLLKLGRATEAFQILSACMDLAYRPKVNIFDLCWIIYTANECKLNKQVVDLDPMEALLADPLITRLLANKGHPVDLVWREYSLYEFLRGEKSKALKYIRRSRDAFNLQQSPVSDWLEGMTSLYEDNIQSKVREVRSYFSASSSSTLTKAIADDRRKISLLRKARHYSPY